jgi:hypothetical protein
MQKMMHLLRRPVLRGADLGFFARDHPGRDGGAGDRYR